MVSLHYLVGNIFFLFGYNDDWISLSYSNDDYLALSDFLNVESDYPNQLYTNVFSQINFGLLKLSRNHRFGDWNGRN